MGDTEGTEAATCSKCFAKLYSGGQTGADRAGLDFAIEAGLEHGGYVPRGRKAGSNPDSLCLEIQALSDFVCSNKIEILNVAGPRESKEPGVYGWTLKMFRLFS
jgi:hypothetical protein